MVNYAKSLLLTKCVYLFFVPVIYKELGMKAETPTFDGETVLSYVIFFDEKKDF